MYRLKLNHHFDASHKLDLNYESKCQNMHGHRWNVLVEITAHELNDNGMIVDFSIIKEVINKLDHACLNDILDFNTTAEMISVYLAEEILKKIEVDIDSIKVEVFESPDASITYEG